MPVYASEQACVCVQRWQGEHKLSELHGCKATGFRWPCNMGDNQRTAEESTENAAASEIQQLRINKVLCWNLFSSALY